MTHPAFLSIPSTGFWVGKFETGYNGATTSASAMQNVNDSSKIIIKPNVYSWRYIQTANAFYTSYNYQRNLDSHMMKNTEWGAAAYLQHSTYGSASKVRINNNSDYITGYAANNEPTCGLTNTNEECNRYCNDETCNTAYPSSVLASTTENITGIYDMSGGAWEFTMGVMVDQSGNVLSGLNSSRNSGFKGEYSEGGSNTTGYDWPDSKYYETYEHGTMYQFDRRILGDATGETGSFASVFFENVNRPVSSWYQNGAVFYYNSSSWLLRGGTYRSGVESGVFSMGTTIQNGSVNEAVGFRIVLTPKVN